MPDSVEKVLRHRRIQALVERRHVRSQEELGRALAGLGHPVTQSTLSRDLRELGIVRAPTGNGGYRYVPGERIEAPPRDGGPGRLGGAARDVRSVECSESLVVIRTRVGRAPGVAVEIDRLALAPVLGTVAGDDTIVVIPRSARKTRKLRKELAGLLRAD